jgi:hypothetical protein
MSFLQDFWFAFLIKVNELRQLTNDFFCFVGQFLKNFRHVGMERMMGLGQNLELQRLTNFSTVFQKSVNKNRRLNVNPQYHVRFKNAFKLKIHQFPKDLVERSTTEVNL